MLLGYPTSLYNDHLLVSNEGSLRRALNPYSRYYGRTRTHFPLAKDTPEARSVRSSHADHLTSAVRAVVVAGEFL